MIEALAPAIEFGIGFGDTALLGIPRYIRQWEGIDHVNWDCSVAYQAGSWTAVAIQAAEGGVGLYRGGVAIIGRFAARRALNSGPGVYRIATSAGDYVGQSVKMEARVGSHFTPSGKLLSYSKQAEEYFPMPGSSRLEREAYVQYLNQ